MLGGLGGVTYRSPIRIIGSNMALFRQSEDALLEDNLGITCAHLFTARLSSSSQALGGNVVKSELSISHCPPNDIHGQRRRRLSQSRGDVLVPLRASAAASSAG